jgi:hypothetical protein
MNSIEGARERAMHTGQGEQRVEASHRSDTAGGPDGREKRLVLFALGGRPRAVIGANGAGRRKRIGKTGWGRSRARLWPMRRAEIQLVEKLFKILDPCLSTLF